MTKVIRWAFYLVLLAGAVALGVAAWAASARPVHNGSLADPDIVYVGRWDKSNPAQYHGYWTDVYLRTRFTGAFVGIRLSSPTQLIVRIDQEPDRTLNASAGITLLNSSPLTPGVHSLLVGSAGQNFEVEFQGLTLAPGAKTLPARQHPLIEFIGDSITTIFSDGNYAWRAASALDCDHTQISFSGVALTSGDSCGSNKTGMDVQYFRLKNFNHLNGNPPVPWNFSYTPKVIVINLGQNDQCGQESDLAMTASCENFVRALRSKFPRAQIVVMRPFHGVYAAAEKSAVQELIAGGETRVHFVDTSGWLDKSDYIDGIHPNVNGQQKVASHLIPLLRPLLR